jgi:hypothetical protein
LRKGRVDGNSLVESLKCSIGIGMGNHLTANIAKKEEKVESPLGFREKLRNPRGEEKRKKRKGRRDTRLIRF